MDLLTLSREYDLPPTWDGHPVTWNRWQDTTEVFICPPRNREPCTACGSVERPVMNHGTVTADVTGLIHPIGRARLREQVLRWRLFAFRCPGCRHDTVHDLRTEQWWDLDHTDYGPDGSHAPGGVS